MVNLKKSPRRVLSVFVLAMLNVAIMASLRNLPLRRLLWFELNLLLHRRRHLLSNSPARSFEQIVFFFFFFLCSLLHSSYC